MDWHRGRPPSSAGTGILLLHLEAFLLALSAISAAPRRGSKTAKGIVGLALASMLLLVGCYTGPGADHFEAVLDELSIPEGWSLAKSETRGPGEEETCDPFESSGCPTAIRTYLTDGDADLAYAKAKDIVTGAGFDIEVGATRDCFPSTSLPCYLFSHRGDDYLTVAVYVSPEAAGLDDETPGVPTVVVRVSED